MVRLEKLVMQGFKSFKRKVSIPFPDGFSVITGPNGSGKTNVSDAICFVLGKTSAKDLRAKKTHDLIFHGGRSKPASDYAIVAMYFDNADRKIPVDDNSVILSRKINNSGVSTYRLNGKVVTRQQIIDLFAQAGIRPDGHNIIQQGDVNLLVEMDAIERREMIDEVAGISDYEDKKEKAEKELKKIEERVREAEILIQERGFTMDKLKKERDAALEYKNLQDLLEKTRYTAVWKSYRESEKELEEINGKLEEKNKQAEGLEKEVKNLDDKLADEEKSLEELSRDIMQVTDQMEVSKTIAILRAEIDKKQSRFEYNKREVQRLWDIIEKIKSIGGQTEFKGVLGMRGVHGHVSDLITVPKEYAIAADIAGGGHMRDIVVDTTDTAVNCVKYLKENKIGRGYFLPLDRIRPYPAKPLPPGCIGWLSDLIGYDKEHANAIEFVFGSTACVSDIDKAKQIAKNNRVRLVTLDGELIEASGAVVGGFLKRKATADVSGYLDDKKRLEKENERVQIEINTINKELEVLATKEKKTKAVTLERDRIRFDERLKKVREERKNAYEKRLVLQQELGRLNIQKAKLEAGFENLKLQWEQFKDLKFNEKDLKPFIDEDVNGLKKKQREIIEKIQTLGLINMRALDEFEALRHEFEDFRVKVDKIMEEKQSIEDTIRKIEEKRFYSFNHVLTEVAKHFREIYKELTGGEAELSLEDQNNITSGLLIKASPSGKKLLNLDALSGGEKTLTAFAFLFAIQKHKPSPFYILDEADATLDVQNSKRVVDLIKKHCRFAQFVVISHNNTVIHGADQVYGISMEDGESKILGIELPEGREEEAIEVEAN